MILITTVSDLDSVTEIVAPEFWMIKINQKPYFWEIKIEISISTLINIGNNKIII